MDCIAYDAVARQKGGEHLQRHGNVSQPGRHAGFATGSHAPRFAFFDFVTHYGGAQRSNLELLARLAEHSQASAIDAYGSCEEFIADLQRRGVTFDVLNSAATLTTIGHQGKPLLRLGALCCATPGFLGLARRLRHIVRTRAIDALWTSSIKGLALAALAVPIRRPPLVMYVRGWLDPKCLSRMDAFLVRRTPHHFVTLAKASRQHLLELGVPDTQITVIPNFIDIPALESEAAREPDPPVTVATDEVRLFMPATLVPEKGHECAIRATRQLVDLGCSARLYLAGDLPPSATSAYFDRLRHLASALQIADRVVFLGRRNDVPAFVRLSSAVVLPSRSEGLPRTLMEAMALGVPVVATTVGGIPELVQDGRTGWLIDVDDDLGLARAVLESQKPQIRERVTAAARRQIQMRFDPATNVRAFLTVLTRLRRRNQPS